VPDYQREALNSEEKKRKGKKNGKKILWPGTSGSHL
jgi:hypothetical protein